MTDYLLKAERVLGDDHSFVHLIDTMPSLRIRTEEQKRAGFKTAYGGTTDVTMPGDQRIVDSARVSIAGSEVRATSDDRNLIRYLVKNRHTTPIEQVRFTFHVRLPIFCARQWIRHRTGCLPKDVKISFQRPTDGKHYPKTMGDVASLFEDPAQRARLQEMQLRCVDEATGELAITKVRKVWATGAQSVYAVALQSGRIIRATATHQLLTGHGWRQLGKLSLSDVLHTVLAYGTSAQNSEDQIGHGRATRLEVVCDPIVSIKDEGIEQTWDMEVDGPHHNFIANGVVVHNSFNEESARYGKLAADFYVPTMDRLRLGGQAKKNKQGSGRELSEDIAGATYLSIENAGVLGYQRYEQLLANGVARELARLVLPLNIYTQWFWTTDLHNLMHFLRLRLHPHAQFEMRQYAEAIVPMAEAIAPYAMEAFKETLV